MRALKIWMLCCTGNAGLPIDWRDANSSGSVVSRSRRRPCGAEAVSVSPPEQGTELNGGQTRKKAWGDIGLALIAPSPPCSLRPGGVAACAPCATYGTRVVTAPTTTRQPKSKSSSRSYICAGGHRMRPEVSMFEEELAELDRARGGGRGCRWLCRRGRHVTRSPAVLSIAHILIYLSA
jgi:hypothetical protein